ncbi:hypothetical protein [Sorangium sp. So ce1024]|uniref:hypothetical protein n=1 Tax=Sorangium sp. So ce1024 TaxID=3133327 RepID=UPI003F0D6FFA
MVRVPPRAAVRATRQSVAFFHPTVDDVRTWQAPPRTVALAKPEAPVVVDRKLVDQIFELFPQITNIQVISGFLKERQLAYSAQSWETLKNERVIPALEAGRLRIDDLTAILAEAEEHGNQHVFLFQCSRQHAADILDARRVSDVAGKLGFSQAHVLSQPDVPTLSDIRMDRDGSLVVKIIERRSRDRVVRERFIGGYKVHFIQTVHERAVNVAKMHRDGILELRISSRRGNADYGKDVTVLRRQIEPLVPIGEFSEWSIGAAKHAIWQNRASLASAVRFGDSRVRNDYGTVITAAARNRETDLNEDESATNSLNAFLSSEEAWFDTSNLWWLRNEETGTPSKNIHVRLAGDVNEFCITSNCSQRDYDYVFNEIKRHNR